jgi:hypothetical protein
MDMREANDPAFIAKLEQYKKDGLPINEADITQHTAQGSLGRTPDLRPFEFRRPKVDMPYLKLAPPTQPGTSQAQIV